MQQRLSSYARLEWKAASTFILVAVLGAADVLDLLGAGRLDRYLFLAAFVGFAVFVARRLYELHSVLDERNDVRQRVAALNSHLIAGNRLLDQCGRPHSAGEPPMYFQEDCLPEIREWLYDVEKLVLAIAAEYYGFFINDGNVFRDTGEKSVAIQTVERRLEKLGEIVMTENKRVAANP